MTNADRIWGTIVLTAFVIGLLLIVLSGCS
jgi:hypothetical protein